MSLKVKITEDMKDAMRAKDVVRLGTIRLLQSAIKQREVDERIELTDQDVMAVIEKMLKQRRDSIEAYESAKRQDLADVEKAELSSRIFEDKLSRCFDLLFVSKSEFKLQFFIDIREHNRYNIFAAIPCRLHPARQNFLQWLSLR